MTLIATVWSPEGFAIAADGLECVENSGTGPKDVQKIFGTQFANGTGFAWAWVGAVAGDNYFDFREITKRVMEELPDEAYLETPKDYFDRIARRILCELPSGVNLSRLKYNAEVIFVGYLAGEPLWVEIACPHTDDGFSLPDVRKIELSPGYFNAFSGSDIIRERMQASGTLSQPLNLSEAVNSVHTYAKTCVENKASIPDCTNFGEIVHVATVTKDGFTWIEKPKNLR